MEAENSSSNKKWYYQIVSVSHWSLTKKLHGNTCLQCIFFVTCYTRETTQTSGQAMKGLKVLNPPLASMDTHGICTKLMSNFWVTPPNILSYQQLVLSFWDLSKCNNIDRWMSCLKKFSGGLLHTGKGLMCSSPDSTLITPYKNSWSRPVHQHISRICVINVQIHKYYYYHKCLMATLTVSGTTRVSQYQNQSGFTGARDSEWQWHQLGHRQTYTSPQAE